MSKSAAARLFGVSLSSVKRDARIAGRGSSLAPRATVYEGCRFPRNTTGESLSPSTVKRLLKRMGFSQKRTVGAMERDEWLRAAWRVMVSGTVDPQRPF